MACKDPAYANACSHAAGTRDWPHGLSGLQSQGWSIAKNRTPDLSTTASKQQGPPTDPRVETWRRREAASRLSASAERRRSLVVPGPRVQEAVGSPATFLASSLLSGNGLTGLEDLSRHSLRPQHIGITLALSLFLSKRLYR